MSNYDDDDDVDETGSFIELGPKVKSRPIKKEWILEYPYAVRIGYNYRHENKSDFNTSGYTYYLFSNLKNAEGFVVMRSVLESRSDELATMEDDSSFLILRSAHVVLRPYDYASISQNDNKFVKVLGHRLPTKAYWGP